MEIKNSIKEEKWIGSLFVETLDVVSWHELGVDQSVEKVMRDNS